MTRAYCLYLTIRKKYMNENLQLISHSQALKSGTELWFLSDHEHSSWNYKIDWYLCFQIKKNKLKKLQKPSAQIQSLCAKYQLPTVQWKPLQPYPILIESSAYLPNLWTMELAYTAEWTNKVYDIWHSLNQPRLRIFVPQPIKKEEIEKKWRRTTKNITVQYILSN